MNEISKVENLLSFYVLYLGDRFNMRMEHVACTANTPQRRNGAIKEPLSHPKPSQQTLVLSRTLPTLQVQPMCI